MASAAYHLKSRPWWSAAALPHVSHLWMHMSVPLVGKTHHVSVAYTGDRTPEPETVLRGSATRATGRATGFCCLPNYLLRSECSLRRPLSRRQSLSSLFYRQAFKQAKRCSCEGHRASQFISLRRWARSQGCGFGSRSRASGTRSITQGPLELRLCRNRPVATRASRPTRSSKSCRQAGRATSALPQASAGTSTSRPTSPREQAAWRMPGAATVASARRPGSTKARRHGLQVCSHTSRLLTSRLLISHLLASPARLACSPRLLASPAPWAITACEAACCAGEMAAAATGREEEGGPSGEGADGEWGAGGGGGGGQGGGGVGACQVVPRRLVSGPCRLRRSCRRRPRAYIALSRAFVCPCVRGTWHA